jgi:ATP-dependent Clp protease protease subunit
VFEGFAIYNQLMRHSAKKTVYVDGVAASISSVIMLAADRRVVAENADVMIHDPWGIGFGNSRDMRKVAETLDKIRDNILDTYVARTGYDRKKLSDMMEAETWFNAKEAKAYGFATEISEASQVSASFTMMKKFKNAPQKYAGPALSHKTRLAEMSMAASAVSRSRASSVAAP